MNPSLALATDGAALPGPVPATLRPTLRQCLVLAALLHAWLVVLVGTAPGGAFTSGDGVWGAIQIRLSGRGPADSPGRSESAPPVAGPVGRAPEPRFGGAAPQAEPKPQAEPGAAQLGPWAPSAAPATLPPAEAPAQPSVQSGLPAAPPPVLTRSQPQAAERPEAPLLEPAAAAATAEPPPRPVTESRPPPSTAPRLAPVDAVEAPALERPRETPREIALPAAAPAAVAR
ncbi:MAG: hypothetical protein JNM08_10870, partial [Rubrivivax sp.]|nr:hypothetical protein [Rubrivivax sp.]